MIEEKDIKEGLTFYLPTEYCKECGIDNYPEGKGRYLAFRVVSIDGYSDCLCAALFEEGISVCASVKREYVVKHGIPICPKKVEQVNHPSHYSWLKDLCGVEPLDICRHLDFNVGNAIKYLLRKDKIDGSKTKTEKRVEDLRKAIFYIQDEIKLLSDGEK